LQTFRPIFEKRRINLLKFERIMKKGKLFRIVLIFELASKRKFI